MYVSRIMEDPVERRTRPQRVRLRRSDEVDSTSRRIIILGILRMDHQDRLYLGSLLCRRSVRRGIRIMMRRPLRHPVRILGKLNDVRQRGDDRGVIRGMNLPL